MHASVMAYLRAVVTREDVHGKSVMEVGSRNINGSPREIVEPMGPNEYVGVDFEEGPGVDVIRDVCALDLSGCATVFDTVICTEMLEHARDWRAAITYLKRATKPGGLLVITTRSHGFPLHEYPGDFWRYSLDHFRRIFADFDIFDMRSDPQVPGVFMAARRQRWPMIVSSDLSDIEVERAPSA